MRLFSTNFWKIFRHYLASSTHRECMIQALIKRLNEAYTDFKKERGNELEVSVSVVYFMFWLKPRIFLQIAHSLGSVIMYDILSSEAYCEAFKFPVHDYI
jgi:hypothetical protein